MIIKQASTRLALLVKKTSKGCAALNNTNKVEKFTAHQIIDDLQKHHSQVLEKFKVDASDRKYQVWERNPLSIDMLSREMLEQKLEYIHHNPCQTQWMLADEPVNYNYSSMSYYLLNDERYEFIKHYMEAV